MDDFTEYNNLKGARLCYIDGDDNGQAFFTTAPIEPTDGTPNKQWGDDWNDAPYQCNAGTPYTYQTGDAQFYEVFEVRFKSELTVPACENYGSGWGGWAVQDMNQGRLPWLQTSKYDSPPLVKIWAGTTFEEFVDLIDSVGGVVFSPAINCRTQLAVLGPQEVTT